MTAIITADVRDIPRLLEVLTQYRQLSRKSWDDILAQEAKEWTWELWGALKKISPTPEAIYRAALARAFRINRRGNSLTKAFGGISWAADAAADTMLNGEKSDLFKVDVTANGVFVKPVRFSSRKSAKLLRGGRTGHKFADGARRSGEVSDEAIQKARAADPSIKRLNLRALGVAIELSLRSRAAKGGTMALQWLTKVWKNRASSTVKTGPIVNRSAQGIPLGTVEFDSHGDASQAVLTGLVPGTARQIQRHNIIRVVEAARIADRMVYINHKLGELKQKALQKAQAQ